jgi:hypothetical protein
VPLVGVYQGTVVSNNDPQRSGRVQVQIPSIGLNSTWALACLSPGSHGSYPVGSTVIIAFESGDATRPVVLGRV